MPITVNDCNQCGEAPHIGIDEFGWVGEPRHTVACLSSSCGEFGVIGFDFEMVQEAWNKINPAPALKFPSDLGPAIEEDFEGFDAEN